MCYLKLHCEFRLVGIFATNVWVLIRKRALIRRFSFSLSLSTTPFAHHCNCSINNLKEQEEAATRLVGNFPAFSLGNLLFWLCALFWLCLLALRKNTLWFFVFLFNLTAFVDFGFLFGCCCGSHQNSHTQARSHTCTDGRAHRTHTRTLRHTRRFVDGKDTKNTAWNSQLFSKRLAKQGLDALAVFRLEEWLF